MRDPVFFEEAVLMYRSFTCVCYDLIDDHVSGSEDHNLTVQFRLWSHVWWGSYTVS
jgi:hypothetical protein